MQDRYAGDVGDYVKLALLRALARDRRLGVAWYLYPDENHNGDGKHIAYLEDASRWSELDPELFNALEAIVLENRRSVTALQQAGILDARYFAVPVPGPNEPASCRCETRSRWFSDLRTALAGSDLVFADPDNGLTDDEPRRRRSRAFGKQLPLSEAKALAEGRSAVIYHHNTRFRGGHDLEVDHWIEQLGSAIAIRANAYNCRTFFVINPDTDLIKQSEMFCERWRGHGVWLHRTGKAS